MEYFDTDVLINAIVQQDSIRHQQARLLVFEALRHSRFVISTMVIHETAYVLARLGVVADAIEGYLDVFGGQTVCVIDIEILKRGLHLAGLVGFKNVNDCIHTAVAERLNCNVLYTYNKSDFTRIQKYTKMNIQIL